MKLLQTWQDSLLLFKPKSFNLFLLVTLKSIRETYFLLVKKWWWLIMITFFFDALFFSVQTVTFFNSFGRSFLWAPLVFIIFLLVRPSVTLKTYTYCMRYQWQLLFFFILIFFLYVWLFIMQWLTGYGYIIAQVMNYISYALFLLPLYCAGILLYLSPFVIFFLLFILDSDKTIRSFLFSGVRALKMVLYNYPFCFVTFTVLLSLFLMVKWLIAFFISVIPTYWHSVSYVFIVLLLPLPICFFTTLYIKKLHEQFVLYFGEQP